MDEVRKRLTDIIKNRLPSFDPNVLTISSLILAILGCYLIFEENYIGIIAFIFAFLFDALDGAVARAFKKESKLGAFLDGYIDRIVEFLFLFPFIVKGYIIETTIILFFSTAMHSFIKCYAFYRAESHVKSSFFPREVRSIVFILLLIIYFFYNSYFSLILQLTAILSIASFIHISYNGITSILRK